MINVMKSILVLGCDEACHSQMISALLKHITFDRINVQTAVLKEAHTNPFAKKVLQELGININKENPRPVNEFIHSKFDIIITTNEKAKEKVENLLMGATKIHKSFINPLELYDDELDLDASFRELRDSMQEWLNEFVVRHRLSA